MPDGSNAAPEIGKVVAFRPRLNNRLGPCERIETSRWAMMAQPQGFTRVLIHDAEDNDPEIGDFLLIYETGRDWASWGVGRDVRGFVIWRPGSGETIGCYPCLRDALNAVLEQPSPPRRRYVRRSNSKRLS
jgi:hypothetical protein